MDRLMDSVHCLNDSCRLSVLDRLDRFEAMFPQLFFAVYIDALPGGTSLREFGFWLLNRGAVGSIDISRPNENGVLLVLDLNGSGASLTIGYGLEQALGNQAIGRYLSRAWTAWRVGDFRGGIVCCVDAVSLGLSKAGKRISERQSQVADGLPPGLRSMRKGHWNMTAESEAGRFRYSREDHEKP